MQQTRIDGIVAQTERVLRLVELAEQNLAHGAFDADVSKVTDVGGFQRGELDLMQNLVRIGNHHRFTINHAGDDVGESALVHFVGIKGDVIRSVDEERHLFLRRKQFVGLLHESRALLELLRRIFRPQQ